MSNSVPLEKHFPHGGAWSSSTEINFYFELNVRNKVWGWERVKRLKYGDGGEPSTDERI